MTASRASNGQTFSVQELLEALTAQLDRAQDSLALKVRTGRPLTWALKDLNLDLKVFVELSENGTVRLRTAGPNEEGASTVHLALTTITRPMVEENTWSATDDTDPRSLESIRTAANLDERYQRQLERMGVRTVGQLKRLSSEADPRHIEAVVGIPVDRLRAALQAAARPAVVSHEVVRQPRGRPLLRIDGANLSDGLSTEVRLAGEPVEVVESSPQTLLVRPLAHHTEGQVEVFVGGDRATGYFALDRGPDGVPAGRGEPGRRGPSERGGDGEHAGRRAFAHGPHGERDASGIDGRSVRGLEADREAGGHGGGEPESEPYGWTGGAP